MAALVAQGRPIEPALGGVPHSPFLPAQRGAQDEARLDATLLRLLDAKMEDRPGARLLLAHFYLLRGGAGDADRAALELASVPAGPLLENARGALLLSRKTPDVLGAHEHFARALTLQKSFPEARFNKGLVLLALGEVELAERDLQRLPAQGPWAAEAAERLQRARSGTAGKPRGEERSAATKALLLAGSPAELTKVSAAIAALPPGTAQDLLPLLRGLQQMSPAQLAARAALTARYQKLRGQVVGKGAPPAEVEAFARQPAVAGDALLWAPALGLLAYQQFQLGNYAEADRAHRAVVEGCAARPCRAEDHGVSLDARADAAARDGDFDGAGQGQEQAERIFAAAGAVAQLLELQRLRALFLRGEGKLEQAEAIAVEAMKQTPSRAAIARLPEDRSKGWLLTRVYSLRSLAGIAGDRRLPLTACALRQQSLAEASALGNVGVMVEEATGAADACGATAEAQAVLQTELPRHQGAQGAVDLATLHAGLSAVADRAQKHEQVVAHVDRALALSGSVWSKALAQLHERRARALRELGRKAEATADVEQSLARAEQSVRASRDALGAARLAESSRPIAELAALLGSGSKPAEELLLPEDRLRAAALGTQAAEAKWSKRLAAGSCVVALLPGEKQTLEVVVAGGGGEVGGGDIVQLELTKAALAQQMKDLRDERHRAAGGERPMAQRFAAQLLEPVRRRCSQGKPLWLLASEPVDPLELVALPLGDGALGEWAAAGIATTLLRALEPEEPGRPRTALMVHGAGGARLPATEAERTALQRLLPARGLHELSGAAPTVEAVLAQAVQHDLLHFAVHGFEPTGERASGYLQLRGEPGRLTAREVAVLRLRPGSRVVLASCNAALPGTRGLAWSFARAGAASVATAAENLDDAAAGRWAEVFYSALSRGADFAEANREALSARRGADRQAWVTITR